MSDFETLRLFAGYMLMAGLGMLLVAYYFYLLQKSGRWHDAA